MKNVSHLLHPSKVHFIIFSASNEIDLMHFKDLQYSFEKRPIDYDLYLMSKCNYLISPLYSTFSGWAAFFGKVPTYRLSNPGKDITLDDFQIIEVLNNSPEHNRSFDTL